MTLDSLQLRAAFGAFPSGVVAVAAHLDGAATGIAASSFTSVSLDPPLVSFSVAKSSSTWPELRRAAGLGISVLAEGHDRICRQLAGPRDERFAGLGYAVNEHGALLLDETVATFECSLADEIEAGDHLIVLLRLHSANVAGDGAPLVFHRSGFARLERVA